MRNVSAASRERGIINIIASPSTNRGEVESERRMRLLALVAFLRNRLIGACLSINDDDREVVSALVEHLFTR